MREKLTARQVKTIAALISEPTIDEAAARASVAPSTIYRWLNDDDFRQALATAEAEALSEAARRIAAASVEAVDYLRSVLRDDEATPSAKYSAANSILSHLPKLRMVGSIEQAIEDLKNANV